MANCADVNGTQQPCGEWTSFPQNLSVLPYQATFDSECPTLPEHPVAQQNAVYDSNLNSYLLTDNAIGQNDANYLSLDSTALSSCLEVGQNFTLYPQCSSNFYTLFDMSTTSSALDAPIELVDSKPYACQVPACKHPYFGDKGGLDRHKREVHGSTTYCCPVTSCKRNIKGFARKYNLLEHQKRCHPGKLPNTQPALIQRSRNHASLDREGPEGSQCSDGEVSSSEMTIIEGVARTSGGRLREELERLYMRRVKLDSDIATLKRTLDILGESSP